MSKVPSRQMVLGGTLDQLVAGQTGYFTLSGIDLVSGTETFVSLVTTRDGYLEKLVVSLENQPQAGRITVNLRVNQQSTLQVSLTGNQTFGEDSGKKVRFRKGDLLCYQGVSAAGGQNTRIRASAEMILY